MTGTIGGHAPINIQIVTHTFKICSTRMEPLSLCTCTDEVDFVMSIMSMSTYRVYNNERYNVCSYYSGQK